MVQHVIAWGMTCVPYDMNPLAACCLTCERQKISQHKKELHLYYQKKAKDLKQREKFLVLKTQFKPPLSCVFHTFNLPFFVSIGIIHYSPATE